MNEELLKYYETFTRRNLRELAQSVKQFGVYVPPVPVDTGDTGAAEACQIQNLGDLFWSDLVRLCFYTRSAFVTITSRGRVARASFGGGPHSVPDVVFPSAIYASVIVSLMNAVDDRWTKNQALMLEGVIPLRWGLDGEERDYRGIVSFWPEPTCVAAHIQVLADA